MKKINSAIIWDFIVSFVVALGFAVLQNKNLLNGIFCLADWGLKVSLTIIIITFFVTSFFSSKRKNNLCISLILYSKWLVFSCVICFIFSIILSASIPICYYKNFFLIIIFAQVFILIFTIILLGLLIIHSIDYNHQNSDY